MVIDFTKVKDYTIYFKNNYVISIVSESIDFYTHWIRFYNVSDTGFYYYIATMYKNDILKIILDNKEIYHA